MDYFKKLLHLLNVEREDDRTAYLKLTQTTSATDRRSSGLTWYPVAIRGTELSRGDYLTVEIERTTHQDVVHQLRFGASAALFSNHDAQNNRIEGTISYQGNNRLKLTLRTDELPDWTRDGKLGIDLLFDENSYNEMQEALKKADALAEGKLIRVLTGQQAPTFEQVTGQPALQDLNPSQQATVHQILTAQDVAIVHGPPGTGKTTTLVQAVKALVTQTGQQVLVVAPSNAAVDLLSDKLYQQGLQVLRIGNPVRVSEQLASLTLDIQIGAHPQMKAVKQLKKQAAEYKNMAHKYKRNFGRAERDQRKALFDEAHRIMKEVGETEQYITDDLINKAQVITATLVGSNHYTISRLRYTTVFIDEAGQALEPACWIPILKAQKVVLAGDHLQLPPTIKSPEAAKQGLSITLLEKCVSLYPQAVTLLQEQYRMNEVIMGFSSREFYGGRLQAHASVARQLLFDGDTPVSFVDTAGCGFDEKPEGTSTVNPEEAAFVFKHLAQLAEQLKHHSTATRFPKIVVISPYKEQIRLLQEQLDNHHELAQYRAQISVNTIDSFQGQERDVVYISLTRSNTEGEVGFLNDIRRMNVAMTRARKKLVVVGDSATLAQHPFYADFIAYTEMHDGYKSAWEFME